jgi:hypothetical protein
VQLDKEQIKRELSAAIAEWTATLSPGKRATAGETFSALVPFVQQKTHYNQFLKILTELTFGATPIDDRLVYRPGERPRLN